ncbi:FAR-17a/AIG1-like protein [Crucibulum laeve]|uniref:FAR-17a/AIG1-like protein n=1 Tax=Crucibulum laeve TaxID=68775 RepID=A0A5C3MBJ5_9AGAR|nr:FAR-17a/AIG1-like protein [Crucibulum laeve]
MAAGRSFSLPRVIFHATSVVVMTYGYESLAGLTVFDKWISEQYGGHFQFLTIQGLGLAWLAMLISLVLGVFPSLSALRLLKRALLIIALPLSTVISSIYWTLITAFPHLILQAGATESVPSSSSDSPSLFRIPLSVDLALHASPAIALLIDFIFLEKKYRKKGVLLGGPLSLSLFALWYGWWVEHCAKYNNNIFPYPFLTGNPFEIRIAIYIGATAFGILSFWMINKLHP